MNTVACGRRLVLRPARRGAISYAGQFTVIAVITVADADVYPDLEVFAGRLARTLETCAVPGEAPSEPCWKEPGADDTPSVAHVGAAPVERTPPGRARPCSCPAGQA